MEEKTQSKTDGHIEETENMTNEISIESSRGGTGDTRVQETKFYDDTEKNASKKKIIIKTPQETRVVQCHQKIFRECHGRKLRRSGDWKD